jgi:DNA-binding response OmpR family regulator
MRSDGRVGRTPTPDFGIAAAHCLYVAKILFVSDDEELAYVCQVVLEALGHEVVVVTDARDALAQLPRVSPRLFIVEEAIADDLDGMELVTFLRGRLQLHEPIIMLSSARHAEQRALAAGADAFIPKPVASSELLAAIDRLLGDEQRRIA